MAVVQIALALQDTFDMQTLDNTLHVETRNSTLFPEKNNGTPEELNYCFNVSLENCPPRVIYNAPKIEIIYPIYSRQGLELNRDFMAILNSPIPLIYG